MCYHNIRFSYRKTKIIRNIFINILKHEGKKLSDENVFIKIIQDEYRYELGKRLVKVVFWASHPNIIAFSKPNNGKYENQLLI